MAIPTTRNPLRSSRRALEALALISILAGPALAEEPSPWLAVNYVSASTVYLGAGRADGLAVGDRLVVVRRGEEIAELEVAYVAEHSAACRVELERRAVEPGDRARVVAKAAPPVETQPPEPQEPKEPVPPPPPPPAVGETSAIDLVSRGRDAEAPWARMTGTVSWRWQSFDGADGRGFDESTARLSLAARQLGRRAYDVRIRLRSREIRRQPDAESDTSDRLYEFALVHDPPDGRFSFQVGRLGASPFAALGYLDGFVGQLRVHRNLRLGAFYGTRPEIEELGFASSGQKYGGFLKVSTEREASGFFAEMLVAGIGEYLGGEVDREYVAVESRLGSQRWHFYQRAEIDLNSAWRKTLAGEPYQVSNLSLSGSFRPTETVRVSISYDQRRRYRTLDTRELPEDLFDDFLRQGFRFGIGFGRPRGWNASMNVGYRGREGGSDATWSFSGSVHHANFRDLNLLVAVQFSGYRGETSEGYLVSLQARKYLRGGHDVGLTVGASQSAVSPVGGFTGSDRLNQWVRLQATARLPRRFFLLGEAEIASGDDLEGQRFILELGYRL